MTCLSIGPWARRAIRGLLAATACALLAACGSSSVVSNLKPTRFISVGDSFLDVGQDGALYTVNDGTANWIQQMTAQLRYQYGVSTVLKAVADGGLGYAQGYARVATPGVAPSVTQQIDTLLGATTLGPSDVVFVNGGMHDIVAAVEAGGDINVMIAAVETAAAALATQVKRLVNSGGQHVFVMGVYNMGQTPWAQGLGMASQASTLSVRFNDQLLTKLADMSGNPLKVLVFDPSVFFNDVYNRLQGFNYVSNVTTAVCTTPDALTCTTGTLISGDYNSYLYADKLHFTPLIQRWFLDEGYSISVNYNPFMRFKDVW